MRAVSEHLVQAIWRMAVNKVDALASSSIDRNHHAGLAGSGDFVGWNAAQIFGRDPPRDVSHL